MDEFAAELKLLFYANARTLSTTSRILKMRNIPSARDEFLIVPFHRSALCVSKASGLRSFRSAAAPRWIKVVVFTVVRAFAPPPTR